MGAMNMAAPKKSKTWQVARALGRMVAKSEAMMLRPETYNLARREAYNRMVKERNARVIAGELATLALNLVALAGTCDKDTVRIALAELQRVADEDPDPNTAGAVLRISGALEGVSEGRRDVSEGRRDEDEW